MEDKLTTHEGTDGILQRLRESPRTVSAAIIILIIGAAIYAFSDNGAPTPPVEELAETPQASPVIEPTSSPVPPESTAGAAADTTPIAKEPVRTEQGFVETANKGDGITHLARRATAQWLQENKVDFEVKKEHLIYIEDYIKDQVGSAPLEIGQEKLITFDLIAQAVGHAKELNDGQLKNLSQYTIVFP